MRFLPRPPQSKVLMDKNKSDIEIAREANIKPINEEIYKQSTKYREDFIRESLQRVINKIDGSLYADFNQDKK